MNQASTVNGPAAGVSESLCQTCSSGCCDALLGTCSQTSYAAQAPRQDQDTVHGEVPSDATAWYFIGDLDVQTDILCSDELEVGKAVEVGHRLHAIEAVESTEDGQAFSFGWLSTPDRLFRPRATLCGGSQDELSTSSQSACGLPSAPVGLVQVRAEVQMAETEEHANPSEYGAYDTDDEVWFPA